MTNPTYYVQCALCKGNREKLVWLPTKIVDGYQRGQYLRLKDRETKEWEGGWLIELIYLTRRRTEEDVLEAERDYLTQREASDV